MPRPCTCDRFTGPEYKQGECRLCWLYKYDERYRRLFDNPDFSPTPIATEPKQFPSLLQQAANFAGSVIRHVAGGMQNASEEEQSRRMSLCMACEYWQDERCSKC